MKPPGDCAQTQYDTLKLAVDTYCKSGPSCKGTDCAQLTQALTRLQNCAAAREAIMVQCFKGGDQIHVDELDAARRAVDNCACRVAKYCK